MTTVIKPLKFTAFLESTTKDFLSQAYITLIVFGKTLRYFWIK